MNSNTKEQIGENKCGHFWKIIRTANLFPHCSIVDCVMECEICGKTTTGTVNIDNEGEK